MGSSNIDNLDVRNRDAFSIWKKVDDTDIRILEELSLLGPRNLALIAEHLDKPTTTVRYRVKRMLDENILFFHINPYHTNMGLKKAVLFVEAQPGYEDVLLECMRLHNYWLFLCRVYGPYEGCGGVWTIPKGKEDYLVEYLKGLVDVGVARSVEINWTTCHEGIPVLSRWYNEDLNRWTFDWGEWEREVGTIEGELPWTMIEPSDWPILVDKEDLLIIKELEIDGKATLTSIAKKLGIPLEKVKYHFREHVSKRNLVEGYQLDLARFPLLVCEYLFFKFEFDSHDKMRKFALTLHDKPFPIFMGKVLGEDSFVTQFFMPKWEFRKFIKSLSKLINKGLLRDYHYLLQDPYQVWRETIPYQHFHNGKWSYDQEFYIEERNQVLHKWGLK